MFELVLRNFNLNNERKNIKFFPSFWIIPNKVQHNTILEIIWTLIPCFILLLIAIPSFSLLYAVEDLNIIESTIKVIGNQWYWSYEIPTRVIDAKFDSVMIPEEDLKLGTLRLLEVDNRIFLPVETQIRMLVTSNDVLHSFAVPSLGVKIDACPGRLNQIAIWIQRMGVYYGQCSEICGINHAFMPIVVEAVSEYEFMEWLIKFDSKKLVESLLIESSSTKVLSDNVSINDENPNRSKCPFSKDNISTTLYSSWKFLCPHYKAKDV